MNILTKNISKFVNLKYGKNILLIRHGESVANMSGMIVGWTDSPLSFKGMKNDLNLIKNSWNIKFKIFLK